MNKEIALKILKENGFLVKKMSYKEKDAKRKALREAKKAEEARMKDTTNDVPYLNKSEVREWDRDELEEFGEKLEKYARGLGFSIVRESNGYGFKIIYNVGGVYRSSVMSYYIYSSCDDGVLWNHPHWEGLGKFGKTYNRQKSITGVNLSYLKKFMKEYKKFLDKYFESYPFSEIQSGDEVYLFIKGELPMEGIAIKQSKISELRDNPLVNYEYTEQPDLSNYSDDDDCLIVRLGTSGSRRKIIVVGNKDCVKFKNQVIFDSSGFLFLN